MHELSVTQSLLEAASDYAKKHKAKTVLSVNLIIGDLSGFIDESVQFYWDYISKQTIFENSALNIQHRKAKLFCNACEEEFFLERDLIPCPNCNSINLKIISGNEFQLESIEIET